MSGDIRLMKGNEDPAETAIFEGCDAYFGYTTTLQSEALKYLAC